MIYLSSPIQCLLDSLWRHKDSFSNGFWKEFSGLAVGQYESDFDHHLQKKVSNDDIIDSHQTVFELGFDLGCRLNTNILYRANFGTRVFIYQDEAAAVKALKGLLERFEPAAARPQRTRIVGAGGMPQIIPIPGYAAWPDLMNTILGTTGNNVGITGVAGTTVPLVPYTVVGEPEAPPPTAPAPAPAPIPAIPLTAPAPAMTWGELTQQNTPPVVIHMQMDTNTVVEQFEDEDNDE